MAHPIDSQRPHRTRRQFTAAALVLLASVGWAQQVSAGEPVLSLAIDPHTPTTLYAGTMCSGVLKSLDGGDHCSNTGLTNGYVRTLAINPTAPATLYAGTWDRGALRSLNGGSTWQATGLGNAICGDGLVVCGEQCDVGGESATCDADCTLPQCGDGTLNVTAGEQCDDGNRNPFDGCSNDCIACGNGIRTPPEECDDGNTFSGDSCDAQCHYCDVQCRQSSIVGTGTAQSCTETAFTAALANRSVIFNCGPAPVTITVTNEKAITADTIIDGRGGLITLSGGSLIRLFNVTAALDVRNLTIVDWHGVSGGAIRNAGTLSVTNSTFSGNSAGASGGGALFSGGTARLTNCTLSDNGGATVICFPCGPVPGGCGGGGPVTVTNTIIAESTGWSCTWVWNLIDGGHNLQFPDTSCGATIPSLDPLLDPAGLQDNGGPTQTIALLPGSPAINAGDPDVCAKPPVNGIDQRGFARPGTGHTQCSIGAYEADAFSSEPCTGDCGGTGSVTVDELITLVYIALGKAQGSACPHGIPSSAEVTVALIVQATNAALTGCAA